MKKILILSIAATLTLGACNDDFLEKTPIESQTEATAFKTYSNFKTYSWSLYSIFDNAKKINNVDNKDRFVQVVMASMGRYEGDFRAGYLSTYSTTEPNELRNQTAVSPSSGGGWDFWYIRMINLMTDNIDKSEMTDADKAHWRSVGYFFHELNYMELVSRFGDVPWIDKVVGEKDEDIIYGTRTSRTEVTDKMLERLQYAEKNIKKDGDGKNTINQNVVRTLISRFCLFEGTWRKYHGLGGEQKFLDEAIRVSKELMKAYPTVHSNYDALMCSDDLSKYSGIILYKEYVKDILLNAVGHTERTSSGKYEMHKATVEMYLCSNGKPITNNPQYDGDKSMYDEFRNRDRRLLFQVVPPYFQVDPKNPTTYKGTDDTQEYARLLEQILPQSGSKRLPVFNWSGTMNWMSPNVNGPGQGPMGSRSGYYMWRHYNTWDVNSNMAWTNTCDKPIFYIEEVLLNYAEAMFETGQFSQAVADESINKLRVRAGVDKMVVSDINATFDPKRDQTVDPVLWEIRRERMVELMGEGFGFQDIRRWKKAEWFINQDQMGCYIKKSDYTNAKGETLPAWTALKLVNRDGTDAADEGYLKRFNNPTKEGKGWKDAYYLFPIPLNDLGLNPNLKPNPGWN